MFHISALFQFTKIIFNSFNFSLTTKQMYWDIIVVFIKKINWLYFYILFSF